MNDKEFEAFFGPLAEHSDYKRNDRITFMQDDKIYTGTIKWVARQASGREVDGRQAVYYAVQSDQKRTFPTIVFPCDIIEKK
ncbi:MAG TPA: hypothetical protein VKV40_19330 [Ktedonobacteraceae bacterium]|nr:hypothetical protein [Ktedonobacteraceae bacterium]